MLHTACLLLFLHGMLSSKQQRPDFLQSILVLCAVQDLLGPVSDLLQMRCVLAACLHRFIQENSKCILSETPIW
jgi:hypothetical protein